MDNTKLERINTIFKSETLQLLKERNEVNTDQYTNAFVKVLPLSGLSEETERFSRKCYLEDFQRDPMFNNPLSVEFMTKAFNLDHTLSFLGKKKVYSHDYYDCIQDEQNKNWALKLVKEGIAQSKLGKESKAFELYNSALDADPTIVDAYVAKGALKCKLENFSEAISEFEKALKIDPSHSNAKKYLQIAIVKLDEREKRRIVDQKLLQAKINEQNSKTSTRDSKLGKSVVPERQSISSDDELLSDSVQFTQKLKHMMSDIQLKKQQDKLRMSQNDYVTDIHKLMSDKTSAKDRENIVQKDKKIKEKEKHHSDKKHKDKKRKNREENSVDGHTGKSRRKH